MDRDELFELLEMNDPGDFGYFEQFAELMECEDEVEYDDFYEALSLVSADTLAEINENYFTELDRAFPDDCDDFYEILQSVKDNLSHLVSEADDEVYRREYVNQLYRFHEVFTKADGASVDGRPVSVMEALAEYRASRIDHTDHKYDFGNSLDYVPDYISIRLGGFDKDEYEGDDTL